MAPYNAYEKPGFRSDPLPTPDSGSLHTGRAVMTVRLASCLVVATLALPTVARAQNDSTEALHATLRGWEDDARVTIFDRRGAFHGHLSDRGILQRFNEGIDKEYSLDLVSSSFSMSEDYAWYTRRRGARWWAGSIDHRTLVQRAEIAGGTPLDGTWGFDFLFGQASTMQAKRTAVRATVRRSFSDDRVVGFLTGWLTAEKPEMDLEFGLQFKPGNSDITLAFAALDAFSDLIYQGLGVAGSQELDYAPQPFTARIAMDVPLGRRFRYELYGLVMFPSRIIATNEPVAGGEFHAVGAIRIRWRSVRVGAIPADGGWCIWHMGRCEARSCLSRPGTVDRQLPVDRADWTNRRVWHAPHSVTAPRRGTRHARVAVGGSFPPGYDCWVRHRL